jgi:uncharacterized protein YaaN involved in tellurite resistance
MSETPAAPAITEVAFKNALPSLSTSTALAVVPVEALPSDPETDAAVAKARAELNVTDPQSVILFGSRSQNGVSDIATRMIEGVKNKDIEPASDALNKVVLSIRGFSVTDLRGGKPGWLKSHLMGAVSPVVAAMQRFETVQSQINVIVGDLDRHIGVLMRDIVGLERMYTEALASFRMLKIYIRAGEEEIADINDRRLPALQAKVNPDDALSSQAVADLTTQRQRLERRVYDLKLTRQVTLMSLPQIRTMQDSDSNIMEKAQSTIVNTIPLWKQQIAMLITARHAQAAAAAVHDANDLTNDLLTSTATEMHKASNDVRTEVERGIFDIEAIQKANDEVIGTINDAVQIYQTAAAKRKEGEKVLDKCETDLRQALETAARSR